MKKTGATALVTAHHADDQVETILMRLIRGTRLRYLSGIKEKQVVGEIEIIRPFLHFQKKTFHQFFTLKIHQIRRIIIFEIVFEILTYQNWKKKILDLGMQS